VELLNFSSTSDKFQMSYTD